MRTVTVTILTLLLIFISSQFAYAETQYVRIGTGGVTGVYYPIGGAICRLLNKNRSQHGIYCSVEATEGSIANLNALAIGKEEIELAVVQSDWQAHAYKGTSRFSSSKPNQELRSLFSLYTEAFTVVARADAAIKDFEDLKGKRVSIGNPGSGQYSTTQILLKVLGWESSAFKQVQELTVNEQTRSLCDNNIDAFFYMVGHPNGSVKEASLTCDTQLVNVKGKAIDKLIIDEPYYTETVVPGKMYKGTDGDINTFGVKATLVTTTQLSEAIAYQLVKTIFEDLNSFRKMHPALEDLTPEQMLKGNTAPWHPGAEKYFKEKGWVK